jgi:flagellum-specific ATP synthase
MTCNAFASEIDRISRMSTPAMIGHVCDVTGLTVVVTGLPAPVGSMCRIQTQTGAETEAQVVGFRDDRALLMPLRDTLGIARGDEVVSLPGEARVRVSERLLGRVVDGLGRIIDGGPPVCADAHYPVYRIAPRALSRPRISDSVSTGIRSIDAMLTLGRGQRIGLFAGTGVGKSVLMGMITRYTDADCVVAAMIGERGREVNDFIEKDLGPEGRKKTVMVLSTSDESPVLRVRAAFVATAIAEFLRDRGKNVLLLMDSLTRMAMAQRQIGLAAGEPPATKGYTPSVLALLPQLLERAGRTEHGSVTGLYTVLVEADDINDPIGDAARGVLDGHIWLSRALATKAHYPAIAVTDSISRVMTDIVTADHEKAAKSVLRAMATWNEIEDLVNIGAYAPGSNPAFDAVIQTRPAVLAFLQQAIGEHSTFADSRQQLLKLAKQIEDATTKTTKGQRPSR